MAGPPRLGARLTGPVIDLDAHGRVVPQSDQARRALADRAGRFVLLPTAGDLLLARRTPPAGGGPSGPRCLLAGDLSALAPADLLTFVHQARLSGALTVASEGAERAVAFAEGEVRSARSSAPGERLGEIAVRLGLASDAQVAAAIRPGVPVGRALTDAGVLQPSGLWRCLHEQVVAVFHAVLLAREGTFFMVETEPQPGGLAVSTQSLLLDGLRRIDELNLFRARIPGPDAVPRRRRPRRAAPLEPGGRALLELVDGRRTVAEIAAAARLSDFEAVKALHGLAEAGHLAVAAERAPAEEARLPDVAAGMNALLRRVTAAIPAPARPAARSAVEAFLADGASPFAAVFAGVALGDDGALDPAGLAAAARRLHGRGDPARHVLEALRELLLFQLFLAGEHLGPEEDQALGAGLRRELARLEALLPLP